MIETVELVNPNHLSNEDVSLLNEWAGFSSVKITNPMKQFLQRRETTLAFFTGNRWGKNTNICWQYILRIMGEHPVESKNMRPNRKCRTFRFCAETLPNDSERGDTNTIYPILKGMLPKSWIKKDITARNAIMNIADPQGGEDIVIEFVSYNQDLQKQAGVDRASVWIDESCSKAFFDEQVARTITTNGDIIITLTPCVAGITWQFDEIFENANYIYRSPAVRRRWKERFFKDLPEAEIYTDRKDIAVFMAASDDNPYMRIVVNIANGQEIDLINQGKHHSCKTIEEFKPKTVKKYLDEKNSHLDYDQEDLRRYGIFRQVSGRIFKSFEFNIHVIDQDKYFTKGIPPAYTHARGIDYHPHVPWHCGMIALSPTNEAFIYNELVINPEDNTTLEIASRLVALSRDFVYRLNLIDPLSNTMQTNTGKTTIDDLNRICHQLKQDGRGTGGHWIPWDTKSTRGREEIRTRLKNSALVGTPFNNTVIREGRKEILPTLWVLSHCREAIASFKNWRLDEWSNPADNEKKEMKEKPLQLYSHMNMVWEAVFKEPQFRPPTNFIREDGKTACNYY